MRALPGRRLLLACWLLVVWLLLWGTLRWDVVVAGALVAVAVVRVSNFPYAPRQSGVRLARVPAFLLRAAVDVARGSAQVAWAVVRRGRGVRASVLAVRTPEDLTDSATVLAGHRVSVEPGSLAVEVDRRRHRLYVYQLDTADAREAEAARERLEALVEEVHGVLPPRRRGGAEHRGSQDGQGGRRDEEGAP